VRTLTYSLIVAYLLSHLWAFWRLRVTPFIALRALCVVMSIRAVSVLLMPVLRMSEERWWSACWSLMQPLELTACVVLTLEMIYYATTRLAEGEIILVLKIGAVAGLLLTWAAMHSANHTTIWANLPGYAYTWIATISLLTSVLLRSVKPIAMAPIVSRHMTICAIYLWVWAFSDVVYPTVRQGTMEYAIMNCCSLAALSLCLLFWSALLPSASRHG
jgi:hypothetical protein